MAADTRSYGRTYTYGDEVEYGCRTGHWIQKKRRSFKTRCGAAGAWDPDPESLPCRSE